MAKEVIITEGTYRGQEVHNQRFALVKDVTVGARQTFITVRPNEEIGGDRDKIRINIPGADYVEYIEVAEKVESDEVKMERIAERFSILKEMTRATLNGDIRGMIVVGPPGVGKSYEVEQELAKAGLFDKVANVKPHYEVMKGAMTPLGLYAALYKHSDKNQVLVFDDCDSVLMDDLALNILKAALDSGKKRRIYWNSDSSYLRKEGIPEYFDFHGSVIFITNIRFDNLKSKKLQDHLNALRSRCHYIDTAMRSNHDLMLRIKDIHNKGALFDHYHFQGDEGDQVVEFMGENIDLLNEVSLRMATKIADLIKISPKRWKRLATTTCMASEL